MVRKKKTGFRISFCWVASEQKRAQILDEVLHIPHGPCNVAFTYNNISVQLVRLNKIGRSSDQFVGDEPSYKKGGHLFLLFVVEFDR